MCNPTWPTTIGKQVFAEYAAERGWTADQIEKAWQWCTARQNKINVESEAARQVEAARAKAVASCQCCYCRQGRA